MTDVVTLYTTAGSEEEALRLGRALVEDKLAACANIIPGGRSVYVWEGGVTDEPEVYVLFKTRAALADRAVARIAELHSYDTPCVAVWPWAGGHRAYMDWVAAETQPPG